MPLYEYRCNECAATLEAIQAVAAPPLQECPECGRSSLKKLLSAPAFQFKGSGWYVNDYARKDKSSSGGDQADAAANGAGADGSDGAGESSAKESSSDAASDKPSGNEAASKGARGSGADAKSAKSEKSSPATAS